MRPVLVLRPQPGASATARDAQQVGLDPIVAPLFSIEPRRWTAPDARRFDAVMLTSANAVRMAGPKLARFRHLPCYAVGRTTGWEASSFGFKNVRTGQADAAALVAMMTADGVHTIFHPCGEHHSRPNATAAKIVSLPVYAAIAVARLPSTAKAAIERDALVLLHSARAAAHFSKLVAAGRALIDLAAIGPAVAAAAGSGWQAVHVADRPRDAALLELARRLCQKANP